MAQQHETTLKHLLVLSTQDFFPKVESKQISLDLSINENRELKSFSNFEEYKSSYDGNWFFESDVRKAAQDADAVVILTEWSEYNQIDWNDIGKVMRKPSWVFDARSIVDKKKVINANLNLWKIGDGS